MHCWARAGAANGDMAGRETVAGAFDAAAARASRPNYRDYDKAEKRAGLVGEGAQVRHSLFLHAWHGGARAFF